MATQIEQERIRVVVATHAVTRLQVELEKQREQTPALAHDIDALVEQLHALAGTRASSNPHNGWAFPPRSVRSLRWLGETLDKLEHAVDESDNAPSPDARAGLAKIKPLTDATLAAWTSWQAHGLPAFNAKLKSGGHEPIVVKQD
jgi:hypothetical protein